MIQKIERFDEIPAAKITVDEYSTRTTVTGIGMPLSR
jgi:hypothetical protein